MSVVGISIKYLKWCHVLPTLFIIGCTGAINNNTNPLDTYVDIGLSKTLYNMSENVPTNIMYHIKPNTNEAYGVIKTKVTHVNEYGITWDDYKFEEPHVTGTGTLTYNWPANYEAHYCIKTNFKTYNIYGGTERELNIWKGLIAGSGSPGGYFGTLEIWSGNMIKGAPGDTLDWPVAHHLVVKYNPGDSMATTVTFITSRGKFIGGYDTTVSGELLNYCHSTIIHDDSCNLGSGGYLASAKLYYPDTMYVPPYYNALLNQIYVKATLMPKNDNDVDFIAYVLKDWEGSHNLDSATHCHQRNAVGGKEVLGDNYLFKPDTISGSSSLITDPGDSAKYKDVWVELDWYQTDSLNATKVQAIADTLKAILETAGIKAYIKVDQQIPSGAMDPTESWPNRASLLRYYRNYNGYSPMAPGISMIHVILGTKPYETSLNGAMAITQEFSGEPGCTMDNMHFGSGPFLGEKDKAGCYVFVGCIERPGFTRTLSLVNSVALCTAHEVGHALGMAHFTLSQNVMSPDVGDLFVHPSLWVYFRKFSHHSLDGSNCVDGGAWTGMNTKHVLGIDCAYFRESNY